jgi:Asp/Glu/hydantoin racemase
MAQAAVRGYERIGVLATLPTTLDPTVRLLEEQARAAGKQIAVVRGLAEGAYHALVGGEPERHDALILEAAQDVASQVEAIVLAQGSMARMESRLAAATGLPVLSSLRLGVTAVKAAVDAQR